VADYQRLAAVRNGFTSARLASVDRPPAERMA